MVPTFDDVAVYFSRSEWKSLSASQREMYKSVMTENYQCVLSLGYPIRKPEIVSMMEVGEELWSKNDSARPGQKE
nr:KRAB zinc finger protein [synthetic construct]ABZ04277.1 KRAB zinc finger protein [synthetic construct]ABZ04278.1 KRAB zinc finger protein [synthetic construct]